jgi:hypothetical protein
MKMKLIVTFVGFCLAIGALNSLLAAEPPTLTIQEIQQGQNIPADFRVRVIGVAPAATSRWGYTNTFIVDEAGGPWSGVMAFDLNERLAAERGDKVSIVGTVEEYYDKTEINLTQETEFPPEIIGTGVIPPPIQLSTGSAAQEQYEACLIRFANAEVLTAPDAHFIVTVSDGSGEFLYALGVQETTPEIGTVFDCLTGINDYSFEDFKIRARDAGDRSCSGEVPTATPAAPTATPNGPTPTPGGPTATPTPGYSCNPILSLSFVDHESAACFQSGDSFAPQWRIDNTACEEAREIYLYIALEVSGLYFFYPDWTQSADHVGVNATAGRDTTQPIMPAFSWPSGVGSLSGLNFYGILTEPDASWTVVGDLAILPFCYQ